MIREFVLACAKENQKYLLEGLEETSLAEITIAAEDFVVLAMDYLNMVTDEVLDEVDMTVWRNILRTMNQEHTAPILLERSQRVILEFVRFDMPSPVDADTVSVERLTELRRALLRLEVTRMLRRFYGMCRPRSFGSLADFFRFLSELDSAAVLILGVIGRPLVMQARGEVWKLNEEDKDAVPLFATLHSIGRKASDANAKIVQMMDIQADQIEQSVLEMHAVLDNILMPLQ